MAADRNSSTPDSGSQKVSLTQARLVPADSESRESGQRAAGSMALTGPFGTMFESGLPGLGVRPLYAAPHC
jgi:hypothetical protein